MSKEFDNDKELKELGDILNEVLIDEEKNNYEDNNKYEFEVSNKKKQDGYMKKILVVSVLASFVIGFASNSFFSGFKSKRESKELLKTTQNANENNEKKYDNYGQSPYENKDENNSKNNGENPYGNNEVDQYKYEGENPYRYEEENPYRYEGENPYRYEEANPYRYEGENPYGNNGGNQYRYKDENPYRNKGENPYGNERKIPYGNKNNGKDFSGNGGEPSKNVSPAQKANEL